MRVALQSTLSWMIGRWWFPKTVRVCAFGCTLNLSCSDAVSLPSYRTEGSEVGQKYRGTRVFGSQFYQEAGRPQWWKSGARARASTCFKKIRCPSKHLDLGCDVDQPHRSACLSLLYAHPNHHSKQPCLSQCIHEPNPSGCRQA